jgi:hypothetical protein
MSFVYVHMSLSSKLVPDCVPFITATFNLSSQHLCTEANTLPARGLPRARCPHASSFFRSFSKKNSDNFVEAGRTSEKVFKWKLELAKRKDGGLHGITSRCSFKVPSANAFAAMARRLASTSIVSGFHPAFFQGPLSDRQDSGLEKCIHKQNPS